MLDKKFRHGRLYMRWRNISGGLSGSVIDWNRHPSPPTGGPDQDQHTESDCVAQAHRWCNVLALRCKSEYCFKLQLFLIGGESVMCLGSRVIAKVEWQKCAEACRACGDWRAQDTRSPYPTSFRLIDRVRYRVMQAPQMPSSNRESPALV